MRRRIVSLFLLALLIFGALLLYGYARQHPEDVPWTAPDLGQPSAPSPVASSPLWPTRARNASRC